MEIANKFHKTLATVRKFKKVGLKLILLNESGKEVLRFKKVD
jgi:heat shock protein HslJ